MGGGICRFFFFIQQGKDPLQRCHGPLHDAVLGREIPDRTEKFLNVLDKGHQGTEGQQPLQHLSAAVPDDQAIAREENISTMA